MAVDIDVTTLLSGRDGLVGVRRLLLDPQPCEALRRALESLLPSADMLGPCRIHRAKYKPGRYLTAYYDVGIRDPDAGKDNVRQIEVTWMPQGSDDPRGAMPDLLAMQDEALRRGVAAPFRQLMAGMPEWGMRVQVAPLDVSFPQLVRVSEPRYVRDMLASVAPVSRYAVTAIRYRPGQRHVLRYDPADGRAEGDGTLFAKIYNSDKGARTFGVVTRTSDWLASQGDRLTSVKPQAYLAGDRAVLYPYVSGTPLSHLLRHPGPETAKYLRLAGVALQTLHRIPTTLVELQPHTFAKEIKGIVSASEHLSPLLPATSARIAAILDRARELHERLPQEPEAFAYGDFKADHLWVTPAGLTLIDFDTCYLFDPAIDVGKFLADLQWWYASYGQAGVEQAQDQFLAGYAATGEPPERLARARLYEALVLVKATVRRVRLFDDDWAPRTERLIERADALLARLEAAHAG